MKMKGTAIVFLLLAVIASAKGESTECSAAGVVVEAKFRKQVLTSPGYDTDQRLDNIHCMWVIRGPEYKYVKITITDMNLRDNSQCMNEYLDLEYQDSVEPYLRYCGKIKPREIILSLASEPRVKFVSDGLNDGSRRGFKLEYELVENKPGCAGTDFACKQPFKCISSEKLCDGLADCEGGEDEANCGHKATQPTECGVPEIQPDLDRIVGGQIAVEGSWPWLASIQGNYIWPSGHGCGAAILNDLYVLTAGHCVVGRFFKSFRVKFGDYNQYQHDDGEFTRELEMYYLHPNYSRFNATDDLAVVKLSAPIKYTDRVSPVCLPKSGGDIPVGTLLYVAGWGTTESRQSSDVIRQVSVPTIDTGKCKEMVTRTLPERTICTGHEEGGKNPCFGDSGGPLVREINGHWTVEGVVSWGPTDCAAAGEAAVYTKISDHVDWIKSVIAQ